ncbi:hypothetical protein ABFT23_13340 [Nocardioides sp. C4-1]|uniref:hypothetical protein n=1 Tax=Nocardioides sp. C4-1 TaxID=3151851 RepID=UPI0032642C75
MSPPPPGQPYRPGPPPGWSPAPGMFGAVHKPGAIPLRPLSLGDLYDGAFRIIRFNPKATVGSAVLVAAVAMAVPVLVTAVLTWTIGLAYDPSSGSGDDVDNEAISYGLLGVGVLLQALGLVFVTGMVVHVVSAAAVGRRLTLGQAWSATHGRRWRLVGLAAVLGLTTTLGIAAFAVLWVVTAVVAPLVVAILVIVATVVLFFTLLFWFWIRVYYLAVPPMMIEGVGVFASIARGYRLSRGAFWRLFGIGLLTWLIAAIAGQMLAVPFTIAGELGGLAAGDDLYLFVTVLGTALAQVTSTAFVAPFTSAVTSLQYVDQRIRKEAYDVELMRRAGILES